MSSELYRRFDGYDELKPLLEASDEEVLVRLGKPTLIRIPGTDTEPRTRVVGCLLHGNEDSGYRAVLELLRSGAHFPFDLVVLIGNVRAASTHGWFAHRFLDDQEDFNRVWGLDEPTTRTRRSADAVLTELSEVDLEAAIDLHNNTGQNPYYAILPRHSAEGLHLAAVCTDMVLMWGLRAHTFMEALTHRCPTAAVECGLPGLPENTDFASEVLQRFTATPSFATDDGRPARRPEQVFEMQVRVRVRPEVPFAFGGTLNDDVDLVLAPGLDSANFGMLLAGSTLGRVHPGASALPLEAIDMAGRGVAERYFAVTEGGEVIVTQDVTPAMMTTSVVQARRDCLFYIARRRA